MVSRAFWGSLGPVLVISGGILGAVWGYILIQKKRRDSFWGSLGFVCSLLAADDGLGSVDMLFISPRSLLGLLLSSRTVPPTLENVDFTMEFLTFLKNQSFRPNDGFESLLGPSRASFGSFWGSLGNSLAPLDRSQRASRFVLELSWAWFARFLLPKMALERRGAVFGSFWVLPRAS